MQHQVLKLTIDGMPDSWITPQEAAAHYATGEVAWTLGGEIAVLRGGISRATGLRSSLAVHAIVAVRGVAAINLLEVVPTLTNRKLFARDRNRCAYCLQEFAPAHLTRDHIVPKAQGGKDLWLNTTAACRSCNTRKAARTPEQAGMPLGFAPYIPSRWESLILSGRRILADQHDFLAAKLPSHSRAKKLS